ncbi:MAG: hypothetical protein P9X22_00360 [Candidatus Zapsychrus exili]|nr:hypothetical protein [Candidatus Zapsychrus exili]
MYHRYTEAEKKWLKGYELTGCTSVPLKKLAREFKKKFKISISSKALYAKAAILQGKWPSGNGGVVVRSKHHYTFEQKNELETCNLPGSSLRSKKSWGRKMNKILGTKCTWDALLHQAKSLRGDWQPGGKKKEVSKPQDTRIKVGTKSKETQIMEDQEFEYILLLRGEEVLRGEFKIDIFEEKNKGLFAVVNGKRVWQGDIGDEVVVGKKDLD